MTASNSLGTGEPSAPVSARTQGAGKKIHYLEVQIIVRYPTLKYLLLLKKQSI